MDKVTTVVSVGGSRFSGGLSDSAAGENESICPTLSFKQRVIGCLGCLALGLLFSILSWVTVFTGDYAFFGVLFTLGNVVSIGGTLFLAGPYRQVKNMFNEGRWIATTVYLISMVLTILAAVLLKMGGVVILFCLVQYGAMCWYILSYIPFARDLVKNAISSVFKK